MPSPSATLNTANSQIIVNRNCPSADNINEDNYYNKVTMNLYDEVNKKNYRFSFLLNCDEETRHKKFEVGYLLIALINAFIIIGVAVFSKIWSIKYHDQPIYI